MEHYLDIIPKELIFIIASKISLEVSTTNFFKENFKDKLKNELRDLLHTNRKFLSMRYFHYVEIDTANLNYNLIYFSVSYNFDYGNPNRILNDNILEVEEELNRHFRDKVYKDGDKHVKIFLVHISLTKTDRIGIIIKTKQIFGLIPALIPLDLNYFILSKIKNWFEIEKYAEAFDITLDNIK